MAQLAPDYGQQFFFALALEDWGARRSFGSFVHEFIDQLDLDNILARIEHGIFW